MLRLIKEVKNDSKPTTLWAGKKTLPETSETNTSKNKMVYSNLNISTIILHRSGLRAPTKEQNLPSWIKRQNPTGGCLQKPHLKHKDTREWRASLVRPPDELLPESGDIVGCLRGLRSPILPDPWGVIWRLWAPALICPGRTFPLCCLTVASADRRGSGHGGPACAWAPGEGRFSAPHLLTPGIPEFTTVCGFSYQSDHTSSPSRWSDTGPNS